MSQHDKKMLMRAFHVWCYIYNEKPSNGKAVSKFLALHR